VSYMRSLSYGRKGRSRRSYVSVNNVYVSDIYTLAYGRQW
jgi:hypothetical protein